MVRIKKKVIKYRKYEQTQNKSIGYKIQCLDEKNTTSNEIELIQ